MSKQFRSWLTVPGDDAARLGDALVTGADVVVVDLARQGTQAHEARANAAQWLSVHRQSILEQRALGRWVRIAPLGSREGREDLMAVMPSAPDGIVLPLSAGPEDVRQLAADLYELEQRHQIAAGSTKIVAVVGETPHAAMTIAAYLDAPHARLAGLSWSPANLSRTIGARRYRAGRTLQWTAALAHVRAQTLLAAHSCGLVAIDAAQDDLTEAKAFITAVRDSRSDGFTGIFVGDAAQVTSVNEAFAADGEDTMNARRTDPAADAEADEDEDSAQIDHRLLGRHQAKAPKRAIDLDEAARTPTPRPSILRPA